MVGPISSEVLSARMLLYRVSQSITGSEPVAGNLDVLFSDVVEQAYRMCVAQDGPSLEALAAVKQAYRSDAAATIDTLRDEYTRLFLGPNKLIAPPWESSYLNGGRQLFQESTLEVRKIYLDHDVVPAEYRKVADDHIALELGFMAMLAQEMADAGETGAQEALAAAARKSESFLTGHMLTWAGRWADDMQQAKGTGFYPAAAALIVAFLEADRRLLSSLR